MLKVNVCILILAINDPLW